MSSPVCDGPIDSDSKRFRCRERSCRRPLIDADNYAEWPDGHPELRDLLLDAWEDEQELLRAEADYPQRATPVHDRAGAQDRTQLLPQEEQR